MKYLLSVFTSGLLILAAGASAGEHSVMERLRAQTKQEAPAVAGENPVGDDEMIREADLWDPARFNPNRIIRLNYFRMNYLMGLVDTNAVRDRLGDLEPVEMFPGKAQVLIGATQNLFEGCTCPPYFNELMINVFVKGPEGSTAVHVAPIYMATDHLKRQHSLVTKFSIGEQFAGIPEDPNGEAHIGYINNAPDGTSGFYMKNQDGEEVLRAERLDGGIIPAPQTLVPVRTKLVFHTAQGSFRFQGDRRYDLFGLDGYPLPGSAFNVLNDRSANPESKSIVGFIPLPGQQPPAEFVYGAHDKLTIKSDSEFGRFFSKLNFVPLFWNSQVDLNSRAWTNPKQ